MMGTCLGVVSVSCLAAQVPIGKLNSIADIFEDEHFEARGNLTSFEEPGIGEVVVPSVVPTLSETPGRISGLGPSLGNATLQVMNDLLALPQAEIDRLRQKRII